MPTASSSQPSSKRPKRARKSGHQRKKKSAGRHHHDDQSSCGLKAFVVAVKNEATTAAGNNSGGAAAGVEQKHQHHHHRLRRKARAAGSRGTRAKKEVEPAAAATVVGVKKEDEQEEGDTSRVLRRKDGTLVFAGQPTFRPNLAPFQVMQLGSFGGTYWRPIESKVTAQQHKEQHKEFPRTWFAGLSASKHLTRAWKNYDPAANRLGVKCGGSLAMWEDSGWIHEQDPYGWFQWYCRFFRGRRSFDDGRQVARWRGVCSEKGRFRNQLIGKCARGGKSFDDASVSPVIRQTLQHWGYILTAADAAAYATKKGLPKLPPPSARPALDLATAGVPEELRGSIKQASLREEGCSV